MSPRRLKFLCVFVCAFFAYAGPASTQATDLFISEYIEGSSNNKAIEIFNGTGAAVNLAAAGYTLQMFFNGNTEPQLTIGLTGTVAAGDVYVIAQSAADAAILAQADQTNGSGWFNGDDAVVLRKGGPAGPILDVIGQIGSDPGAEWGSGLTSTQDNTLRRKSGIMTGDTNGADPFDPSIEWDGFASNTFDGLGNGVAPPPPPPTLLEIHEIQGSGAASPVAGLPVETLDNIVTAKAANGFFMQTPQGRADDAPETSEGIFVFTGAPPAVQVGDQVDVIGKVQEFNGLTEIADAEVSVDSSGHSLPAPVTFGASLPSPLPGVGLEHLEGMLVRAEGLIVTAPTDNFGDTPVVAGGARAFREPGILFPGLPGLAVWDGNPEIFEINANGAGLADAAFAGGAIIDVAEGPLNFSFGDFQIWPTTLTFTPRPIAPRPVRQRAAGEFTVAAQNLLRLYDTVNDPGVDDEVASAAVFDRRLAKASLHIREVLGAPDVLVMEEVENLGVAQALAARIGTDDPSLSYTAYLLEGHDIGGIDTGVLVRDTVSVTSVTQLGFDSLFTVDNPPSFLHDRPPLVVQGEYAANGSPFAFTVIGVHNRSLNDVETSARVRQKRLAQAIEIAGYVQSLQAADPSHRIVVTGDFNAFEFSDGFVDAIGIISGNLDPSGALLPGDDVVNPDLTNQVVSLPASERYSFVFDGSAQTLDHTLTSAGLGPFVRGFAFSRGNADVPGSFSSDPATALRTSDHDGAVLFVMTDRDADNLPDDADACPSSVKTTVTIGDCTTSVPDQIFSNGCSISDTLSQMAAAAANHGQFVSSAAQFLTELREAGTIDNKQRGAIVSCAARSK